MNLPLKRYKLIDAFRGIAILWIVCFHVMVGVREQYGEILNGIISHGYLGVQIFFIISGYGFAVSFFGGKYPKPNFYLISRLRRIYFPYWWHLIFAALIIPLSSSFVSMIKSRNFEIDFVDYTFIEWIQIISLSKVFSAENWKLNLAFLPLNGVVWYIAIIVQIYIFLSLCIYSKKNISKLLLLMFICSLLTTIPYIKQFIPYGLFIPYFSRFYIGILVYKILDSKIAQDLKFSLFIVLFCSIAVFFCVYINSNMLALSFSILIGSIFIALHKYDDKLCENFVIKILLLLGAFSYSLYLLHVPLRPFVGMFVHNLVPLPSSISSPFFLVPGIVVLSYFWYLFFEKVSTQVEILYRILHPLPIIRSGMNDVRIILKKSNMVNAADAKSRAAD